MAFTCPHDPACRTPTVALHMRRCLPAECQQDSPRGKTAEYGLGWAPHGKSLTRPRVRVSGIEAAWPSLNGHMVHLRHRVLLGGTGWDKRGRMPIATAASSAALGVVVTSTAQLAMAPASYLQGVAGQAALASTAAQHTPGDVGGAEQGANCIKVHWVSITSVGEPTIAAGCSYASK